MKVDQTIQHNVSRRAFVQGAVTSIPVVALVGLGLQTARAAALTPLDPSDPMAQSLGYVADTSQANAAANPTHKPDQKCATCAQFQGKAGETEAGCNLFPGKVVTANGWCRVWAAKS